MKNTINKNVEANWDFEIYGSCKDLITGETIKNGRSYMRFIKTVLESSESKHFIDAVKEWEVIGVEIDEELKNSCICGKENLKYLFTIGNKENGNQLYPIGIVCVKKFHRESMEEKALNLCALTQLADKVKKGQEIEFTTEFFTRKLIKYLYDLKVLKDDKENDFDGYNDYYFLIKHFNRRNKSPYGDIRNKKIIEKSIKPFINDVISGKKVFHIDEYFDAFESLYDLRLH